MRNAENGNEKRVLARTLTVTWLALIGATIAGWLLSGSHGDGSQRSAALVVIAAGKISFVFAVFMGLLSAPRGWRVGALAWIVLTAALVYLLYGRHVL